MKKHNHFKIVLITILVLFLLTWILPVAIYSGGYAEQGRVQMGLFDLLTYPVASIAYFGYIGAFVLVVGGLYGVLNKTKAYRMMLDKLVAKAKGKEALVILIVMVLMAIITSFTGLTVGLLVLFPFVIALVLMLGYNKIVAALVTVGSVTAGTIGTVFSYAAAQNMNQILSLSIPGDMTILITRIALLVVTLALLIFNTLWYGKKVLHQEEVTSFFVPAKISEEKTTVAEEKKEVKKTVKGKDDKKKSSKKTKSKKNDKKEEPKKDSKKKAKKVHVWPLVVILDLLLVLMILGSLSWVDVFKTTIFTEINSNVLSFKVFGFDLFGKVLGTINPLGSWTISELISIVFLATVVIACIYRVKFNEFCNGFVDGAKKAMKPALLMILIYAILFISTYHPFQLVIYNFILKLTDGFNILTTSLVAILASFMNIDMTYTAQSVLPYLTSIVTDTTLYPLIGIMFQSLFGVVSLVAPTSLVLMATLSALNIPYKEWLKNIWKFLLEVVVVLFIVFTILMVII